VTEVTPPARGKLDTARDFYRGRTLLVRLVLTWSVTLALAVGAQLWALSFLTSFETAYNLLFLIESPAENSHLSSDLERFLGFSTSVSGFLLVPSIVGVAVSAMFEAVLRDALQASRARLESLEAEIKLERSGQ
jgi:hypothetical protein